MAGKKNGSLSSSHNHNAIMSQKQFWRWPLWRRWWHLSNTPTKIQGCLGVIRKKCLQTDSLNKRNKADLKKHGPTLADAADSFIDWELNCCKVFSFRVGGGLWRFSSLTWGLCLEALCDNGYSVLVICYGECCCVMFVCLLFMYWSNVDLFMGVVLFQSLIEVDFF